MPYLKTLEDSQSVCSSEISARAASLLQRFQDPVTVISLTMAQTIIEPYESLNRSVQSTGMTLAGLIEAARVVKILQNMREQSKFDDVFTTVETKVKELELDTSSLPRMKRPPTH